MHKKFGPSVDEEQDEENIHEHIVSCVYNPRNQIYVSDSNMARANLHMRHVYE